MAETEPTTPADGSRPPVIGLLTRYVGDPNGNEILSAARRRAAEMGVDLIVFAVERHGNFDQLRRSVLWPGLDREVIDGLLLSQNHLFAENEAEGRRRLIEELDGLPCLSVGVMPPGHPSVRRDAESIVRHVIDHLVTVHGYRRIRLAMTQEPLAAVGARIIRACGLPELPVVSCGKGDLEEILEGELTDGLLPEAFVVTDGPSARTLVLLLQRHGYLVPDDVAVASLQAFNLDRFMHPPVAACFPSQGDLVAIGLQHLVDHLRFGASLEPPPVSANFSPAASCGCRTGLATVEDEDDVDPVSRINRRRSALLHQMVEQGLSGDDLVTIDQLRPRAMVLLRDFTAAVESEGVEVEMDGATTRRSIADLPRDHVLREALARSLWALQRDVLPLLAGTPAEEPAKRKLRGWFKDLELANYRPGYYSQIDRVLYTQLIHLERVLTHFVDPALIPARVAESLPSIDIANLYAWVGVDETRGTGHVPLAVADNVAVDLPDLDHAAACRQLLDPARFGPAAPRCLVAMQLYSPNSDFRSFITVDGRPRGMTLEHLRGSMATALHAYEAHHGGRQVADRLQEELNRKDLLLQRAQKFEAIGRLAGGIAHDFNNILTVIQNSAELLRRSAADDTVQHRVQSVLDASHRAERLTANLLSFASSQFLEPQLCDLNALIRDSTDLLRSSIGDGVVLNLELADGPASLLADPTQLEQILLNLVVNARDAMPEGGEVTCRTAIVDHPGTGPLPPGGYVRLEIADTGCGIPAEHLPDIFDPFFTTKASGKGTGLGLATTYGIVRQSGGDIDVASTVGTGTTFTIWLPCVEEVDYEADVSPAAEPARGDETILVVDDEEAVCAVVTETLREHGYRVLAAADAATAMDCLAEHDGPVHLLLTDIVMPGVDGVELAAKVQERHPRVKVLFMSGMSDVAIHEILPQSLLVNFLAKPFDCTTLTEKVRAALETSTRTYRKDRDG